MLSPEFGSDREPANGFQLDLLHRATRKWILGSSYPYRDQTSSQPELGHSKVPYQSVLPQDAEVLGLDGDVRISYQPSNFTKMKPEFTVYECPQVVDVLSEEKSRIIVIQQSSRGTQVKGIEMTVADIQELSKAETEAEGREFAAKWNSKDEAGVFMVTARQVLSLQNAVDGLRRLN